MPAVHLDSVSFTYSSAVEVLADVSLSLGPTWHGLVGENGAGKTTLIRLILGDLSPTRGQVRLDPSDAVVAFCPQIVDQLNPLVTEFARSWEAADAALRSRLGLDPEELERWQRLSPGERRRWQLAAAVAARPDVLCVDEPTNHLDDSSSSVLVDDLADFRGVGVVVSHDRRLLDRLTTETIRVADGRVDLRRGAYSVAAEEWRREESEAWKEVATLRRDRDRIRGRLQERRRKLTETQQRDRARRRKAGVSDPDARSVVVKNRQENAARSQAGAAGVEAARLERLEGRLSATRVARRKGGSVAIDAEAARRPVLLSHRGALMVGDRMLHPEIDLDIGRETRLRVAGPNGSGKSTLLAALLERAPIPPGRILWLPQELTRAERVDLLRRVGSLDPEARGEMMAVAARLGIDPERVLDSEEPSPGEARKLWLAEGLGRRVWAAVLDEPTNHLDLPSIERLEEALADYPGALVMVTHDDRLAESLLVDTVDLTHSQT